ncbi:putative membrane protein [Catalinimonas alkaloidigena]|uniref:COG3650 family protein n=1 Tax=Catalinimonas alkaloidigena TaxID=1075417 RepID=UPI002405FD1D|nr:hypothetical protein [Catalinimonas alkaloidigena]MDF9797472.1 putative membrane protein [Catalinimonas alkaloidigena]
MHFFNLLTVTFFLLFALVSCQGNQQASQHSETTDMHSPDTSGTRVEADFIGIYRERNNYNEFKDCSSWQVYAVETSENRLSAAFDSLGLRSGEAMFVRINGSADQSAQRASAAARPLITVTKVIEVALYEGQNACQLPQSKTFTFRGSEPFWSLTISSDSIIFNHFEHEELAYPYVKPKWENSAWVYKTSQDGHELTAHISENDCMDSMSGIRYRMRVNVQNHLGEFEGCGELESRDHQPGEM